MLVAATDLRLDTTWIDYVLVAFYFVLVLGIGVLARRSVSSSLDFLLSGRSLPAWVTGLAFISANLGAIELIGMTANGAQYGLPTVHYYWIGAIPAMVFLGHRDDAVLLRQQGPQRPRVPAEAVQPHHAAGQRGHVRAVVGADRGREPVRARPRDGGAAGLVARGGHPGGRAGGAELHVPRRAVGGDLQRGAAVLRDPRAARPAHRRGARAGRRLDGPPGEDHRSGQRGRAARPGRAPR